MTEEQKAAYIHSQSVAALATIESMKAANEFGKMQGSTIPYEEKDFLDVITDHEIHQSQVIGLFHNL